MRTHYLKTWPGPFAAVQSGQKRHEVRVDDRGFCAGDMVVLEEFDPLDLLKSGRTMRFTIGHVSAAGTWGLPSNTCVFTLLEVAANG